jgi:cell division protein FtsZ
MNVEFMPKEQPSIIKVIGVGGGGSNAVNYMYKLGIKGVDFIVCNTDSQALEMSPVPRKIQLGTSLTEGRGAGSIPEIGKQSAIENIEELKAILKDNTKMVFITAGMGGGTGTGAAPIIAGVAKEMGILTVGIVTVPFAFEGRKRKTQADLGMEELKRNVDTLLIICNDKLREIHGNLKLTNAFGYADNVLATAAKSIAEVISVTLHINVDFADVQTVMRDSGVAIMGASTASGENRAVRAAELALDSPLLNDNNIEGARYILLNITSGGDEITMDEMGDITDFIQEKAGQSAEIIMGVGTDEELGDRLSVTIIATGFKTTEVKQKEKDKQPGKIVYDFYQTPTPTLETPLTREATIDKIQTNEPVLKTMDEESPLNAAAYLNLDEQVTAEESTNHVQDHTFEFTDFPNVVVHQLNDDMESAATIEQKQEEQHTGRVEQKQTQQQETPAEKVQDDDIYKRTRERIEKLKQHSYRISNPNVLSEMEKEPAYKRRNIQLDNVLASSETPLSRFTLSEDQDKRPEISPNNKFLHDKVD